EKSAVPCRRSWGLREHPNAHAPDREWRRWQVIAPQLSDHAPGPETGHVQRHRAGLPARFDRWKETDRTAGVFPRAVHGRPDREGGRFSPGRLVADSG